MCVGCDNKQKAIEWQQHQEVILVSESNERNHEENRRENQPYFLYKKRGKNQVEL
jgi:hypothetical protein